MYGHDEDDVKGVDQMRERGPVAVVWNSYRLIWVMPAISGDDLTLCYAACSSPHRWQLLNSEPQGERWLFTFLGKMPSVAISPIVERTNERTSERAPKEAVR